MRPLPLKVWGDRWRACLDHISWTRDDPRLQRGRELAMAGKVTMIEVRGGCLSGWVHDGEVSHRVEVGVRQATKKTIDEFLKRLRWRRPLNDIRQRSNPDGLPDAMALADEVGLELFPLLWSRATFLCDCGQWNKPCAHCYALLYAFGTEVDADPTLLFELFGFYVRYAVNKLGLGNMRAYYQDSVPMLEEQMRLRREPVRENVFYHIIQREGFPNVTDMMMSLLPDPAYFAQEFKPLYMASYRRTQQALQRLVDGKRQPRRLFSKARVVLPIDPPNVMSGLLFTDRLQTYALTLYGLPLERVAGCHISVLVHYYALHIAIGLLQAGAIAPRAASDNNYNFYVLWMPTELHASVRQVLRELNDMTPENMVYIVGEDGAARYVEEPAQWLVAEYATMLVDLLAPRDRPGSWQDVFFHGTKVRLRYSYNHKKILDLSCWVAPFWGLPNPSFRPYMLVEEAPEEGQFLVSAAVVPLDKPDQPPVTVASLVETQNSDATDPMRYYFYRLRAIIPDIQRTACNYSGCKPMRYDAAQMVHFLDEVVPTLQYIGVQVLLPKSLQELLRPRLSLSLSCRDADEPGTISIDDLLAYDWVLAVGDEQVPADEFERMLKHNESLLRFKSRYILVRKEELGQYRDAILGGKLPVKGSLLHAALAEDYCDHPVLLSPEAREVIRRATTLTPVPLPEGLQATLRPYQERGYAWLYRNMRLGFGSILADDMGLGKTLQAIALILKLKEEGRLEEKKALIVVPTSLLTNWQAEVARFAPALSVSLYHGSDRSQQAFAADITLTTYGVARGDMELLNLYPWRLLVVDEAQNIKNAATKQTRAIVNLKADCRIALSGTPVENRLAEFWSIMQFCNPGYLGPLRQFSDRYAKPIQVEKDELAAARFRRITAPFLLRRLKTDKDIIDDLPDKMEKNEYVSLLPAQAALYQAVVDEAMKTLQGLDSDDAHHLFKRKGIILQMILALKQVCNHPAQYLKNDDLRPEISGKTEHLLELVQSILDAGEKVLIFSQFKQMGEMLVKFIEERLKVTPLFYHGGCTVEQRAELVRRFQEVAGDQVFVLSLKAAGTGLNLTAATHVIHYDLWWNPAVESQATDRAYRIGQHQNVIVHRFITHNTFEEKIDRMIQDKRHLADITVASGEGWIADLTDDELRELFDNY